MLHNLLFRREAIAEDLQHERNSLEQADATDILPLIRQYIIDSIIFLKKQLALLQHEIDDHICKHSDLKTDHNLFTSMLAVRVQDGNHLLTLSKYQS